MSDQQKRKLIPIAQFSVAPIEKGSDVHILLKNGNPAICPHSSPVAMTKESLSIGPARSKNNLEYVETRLCNTACPFANILIAEPMPGETEVPQYYSAACSSQPFSVNVGMAKINAPQTDSGLTIN